MLGHLVTFIHSKHFIQYSINEVVYDNIFYPNNNKLNIKSLLACIWYHYSNLCVDGAGHDVDYDVLLYLCGSD